MLPVSCCSSNFAYSTIFELIVSPFINLASIDPSVEPFTLLDLLLSSSSFCSVTSLSNLELNYFVLLIFAMKLMAFLA